jgi:hypothetical protein
MIAAGALVIGTAAAVRGANQGTNQAALIAGIAVAGVGVIGIFVCLTLAATRYREDARAPLAVTHDRNCPDCFENVPLQVGGEIRRACQVRLHVTNRGRVGVQRVRAYMRVLQHGALYARDHFLHIEHDNDPVGLRQLSRSGENLTVGQPVHFDVALVTLPDWSQLLRPAVIRFEYADPAISDQSQIPLGSDQVPACWKIRVEVSGWTDFRDVVPTFVDCDINVDADGYVSLALQEVKTGFKNARD